MNNNGKSIVMASVILSATILVCTFLMMGSLRKFQNNVISYAENQKNIALDVARAQKAQLKRFVLNREFRLKGFIKSELAGSNIDIKKVNK